MCNKNRAKLQFFFDCGAIFREKSLFLWNIKGIVILKAKICKS